MTSLTEKDDFCHVLIKKVVPIPAKWLPLMVTILFMCIVPAVTGAQLL